MKNNTYIKFITMRKIQHLLSLLTAGMFLTLPAMAQAQSIKLTSAKSVGESISFSVNQLKNGVTVDWGDGVLQDFPATTDPVLKIEGTIKGDTIVISGDKRLNTLICPGQELTSIDLSEVPNLISLYCQHNNLTELDVTVCPKLKDLDCSDNQITYMILLQTKNGDIENLNISNNDMKKVDALTGTAGMFALRNSVLRTVDVSNNKFASVAFSSNPNLDLLISSNNNANNALGLNANPLLTSVVCPGNNYARITLPTAGLANLRQLVMDNNKLAALDLSLSPDLKVLDISGNQLSAVTLHEDVALFSYDCQENKMTFASLPGKKAKAKITHFAYAGQDPNIDITSVLKQEGKTYYLPVTTYEERTNANYYLDLRAYAFDSEGTKTTYKCWGRRSGETEFSAMTKVTVINKNNEYFPLTGLNTGAVSFLKPFEEAYVEITHSQYPDLSFVTTHFAVIDKTSGIEDITVDSEDGLALQPGKGSVTLQSARPQLVNIYDAAGRRVVRKFVQGNETISLPSGIYVINGKKVAL